MYFFFRLIVNFDKLCVVKFNDMFIVGIMIWISEVKNKILNICE